MAGSVHCVQEAGDKEAEVRRQEAALAECERGQRELEAKRNGLNDERKELWRAEAEAEAGVARMKADKQRAEKKARALRMLRVLHLRPGTCWLGSVFMQVTR